jgi:hypothetical protein
MGAHKGRCFRALRRKRNQEKRQRAQPVKAAPAPVRRATVADSLWNQFAALGQVMRLRDSTSKQAKQQGHIAAEPRF